jgi:hypothetical protein
MKGRPCALALLLAACGGRVVTASSGDASSATVDAGADQVTLDANRANPCPPGESFCDGVCVNEQTDNAHCGGCDNVCEAGACQGGSCVCPAGLVACEDTCAPTCLVSLATSTGPIVGIAVDANSVYWLDSGPCLGDASDCSSSEGTVMSVPKSGGTPTTLASGQSSVNAIAVDDENVYWTDSGPFFPPGPLVYSGKVMKIAKSGGTPVTLASHRDVTEYLALGSRDLYWLEGDFVASGGGAEVTTHVMKMPKSGGSPIQFALSAPPYFIPGAVLAVDATSVYWNNFFDLVKAPLGGGTPTTLVSPPDGGSSLQTIGLAVNSTTVFAALLECSGMCGATDQLWSVPKAGGVVTTLASGLDPEIVVADDTTVYWIDTGATSGPPLQGSILTVPTTGGIPTTLATNQENAYPLVVDSSSLYWAVDPCKSDDCPGRLMRLTPK